MSDKKTPMREVLSLHLRATRDAYARCPEMIWAGALLNMTSAVIPYVTIFFSARIINELAGQRRPEELWRWVALTLAVEAALNLIKALLGRWKHGCDTLFNHQKERLFTEKALSMDYADADQQTTRDKRAQIWQNENWGGWGINIAVNINEHLLSSLTGILGAAALTVSLFTLPVPEEAGALTVLNHPLFVAALVVVLAVATCAEPLGANMLNRAWADLAEEARFGNRMFSAFGFICYDQKQAMDIRMYDQVAMAEHYMRQNRSFSRGGPTAKLYAGPKGIVSSLAAGVTALFTGAVYVFTCLKAWAGAFGVGSVTQYVGAVTALSRSIALFIEVMGYIRSNGVFLRTTYEYLDLPNHMYQGTLTTEKRSDRQYDVEFRDVSFRYPGSDIWALRHVNIKFKVGSRLAVVGENGSGKTTFIKLLCRLYDPTEGEILLNGIDIRKYNYRQYMDIFSVVFQDFQLLSQSLGANVAGSMGYDREKAERCLRDAGFDQRLETLPEGLDTMLYKDFGQEGVDLSGGEAQKVAIARALYKDAPFIILDEPTAALDPIAEAEIYEKFDLIAGDKTAIYISHRLSSCKFCDEIAVFHQGQVVQKGSHQELLAEESGKYHQLWQAQAQYYTSEQ